MGYLYPIYCISWWDCTYIRLYSVAVSTSDFDEIISSQEPSGDLSSILGTTFPFAAVIEHTMFLLMPPMLLGL